MADVAAVLANYPLDYHPTQIESLGSAGGMSGAQFWRISSPRGRCILRRWPAEHPTPERLTFIHAVIRHAASRSIEFLPVPATTAAGESFISHAGHLWELAPWMPGVADFETAPRIEKLQAALVTLAEFHRAVADFTHSLAPGSAGGLNAVHRHAIRLRDIGPGNIAKLAQSIRNDTFPELAPLARQFVALLPRAIPRALAQLEPLLKVEFPMQPCLRDIWHDHILFTGDNVTGIVDFGAVDIDTPPTDIARLLGSLTSALPLPFSEGLGCSELAVAREGSAEQVSIWQEGLIAYQTARAMSPEETLAVDALHRSGTVLAGYNWIRWVFIEGREFDDHQQIISRFGRILANCHKDLAQSI